MTPTEQSVNQAMAQEGRPNEAQYGEVVLWHVYGNTTTALLNRIFRSERALLIGIANTPEHRARLFQQLIITSATPQLEPQQLTHPSRPSEIFLLVVWVVVYPHHGPNARIGCNRYRVVNGFKQLCWDVAVPIDNAIGRGTTAYQKHEIEYRQTQESADGDVSSGRHSCMVDEWRGELQGGCRRAYARGKARPILGPYPDLTVAHNEHRRCAGSGDT